MKLKVYLILFTILSVSCGQASRAPLRNSILDVSFSTRNTAWLVSRDNDLIQVFSDGTSKSWEIFAGKIRLVYFLTEKDGWVIDNVGQIWAFTELKGWEVVGSFSDPNVVAHASDLIFVDRNNGWITTSTRLLKTNDGGKTWRAISPAFSEIVKFSNVNGFFPKDRVSGWLSFSPESLAYTADDGDTWQFEHFGGATDILSITCRRLRTCLVGTGGSGLFAIDWDNRKKPERVGGDLGMYAIKSISYSTDEIVWIAGSTFVESPDEIAQGMLMRSEDGGKSWKTVNPPEQNDGYEYVHFWDQANGWLISKDSVFITMNEGKDWNELVNFK